MPVKWADIATTERFKAAPLGSRRAAFDTFTTGLEGRILEAGADPESSERYRNYRDNTRAQFDVEEKIGKENAPWFGKAVGNAVKRGILNAGQAVQGAAARGDATALQAREAEQEFAGGVEGTGSRIAQGAARAAWAKAEETGNAEDINAAIERQRKADTAAAGAPAREQAARGAAQPAVDAAREQLADSSQEIAATEQAKEGFKNSEETRAFMEADGFAASAWEFAKNPLIITAEVIAASAAPAAAITAAFATGGVAAGGGAAYAVEHASSFLDALREQGVDLKDPKAVQAAFESPGLVAEAVRTAAKRGVPVAALDAASLGLAGKFLPRGAKVSIARALGGAAKEAGVQASLGSGGELLGQLNAGQDLDLKAAFLEGIAEIGSGAVDATVAVGKENISGGGSPDPTAQPGDTVTDTPTTQPAETAETPAREQVAAAPSPIVEESPAPEVVAEVPEVVAEAPAPKLSGSPSPRSGTVQVGIRTLPPHPQEGVTDILDWLDSHPLYIPTKEERQGRGEYNAAEAVLESMPLAYRRVFSRDRENSSDADVVTQEAFNQGLINDDRPDALFAEIQTAVETRIKMRKQLTTQATALREGEKKAKYIDEFYTEKKGRAPILADDLAVGDRLITNGKEVRVRAIDPDTESVLLDGGEAGGMREVESGETLYAQQHIPSVQEEVLEEAPFDMAPGQSPPSTGSPGQSPAARGQIRDESARPGWKPDIRFSTTGLVQLASELGLKVGVNRRLRRALGRAVIDTAQIDVKEGLLRDPDLAADVIAHEIGHHIDHVPAHIQEGRLRKKLIPLKDERLVFPSKLTLNGTLQARALNETLKDELRGLSRQWRGPWEKGDKYRESSSELYADFISALLNAPAWTERVAPTAHTAFFGALDDKPDAAKAYAFMRDIMRQAAEGTLAEGKLEQGFAAGRQKVLDYSRADKVSNRAAAARKARVLRQKMLSRFEPVARAEGWRDRAQDGDSFTNRLELNEGYASTQKALFDDVVQREVYTPLEHSGIEDGDRNFKLYLFYTRVIGDRTATGQWLEQNPGQAKEVLTFIHDNLLRDKEGNDLVPGLAARFAKITTGTQAYAEAAKLAETLDQRKLGDAATSLLADDSVPKEMQGLLAAFNVRGMMLNPMGIDVVGAQDKLREMRKTLGTEDFGTLADLAATWHGHVARIVEQAAALGLVSEAVYTERIAPNLGNYVPFQVVERLRPEITSQIKSQYGTTGEINDPVVATHIHIGALLTAMQRQNAAQLVEEWAIAFTEPYTDLGESNRSTRQDIEQTKLLNPDKGFIDIQRDGKRHVLMFEDDLVGEMLAYGPELEFLTALVGKAGHAYGAIFTQYAPGFLAVTNPFRDTRSRVERLGWTSLRDTWKGIHLGYDYARAVLGAPMTPEIRQMVEEQVLPGPSESIGKLLTHSEAEAVIMSSTRALDVIKGRANIFERADARNQNALDMLLDTARKGLRVPRNAFVFYGAFQEAAGKAAANETLKRKGFKAPDRVMLARLMGVPNPGTGGTSVRQASAWMLFYRVYIQGHRATRTYTANDETRAGFLTRHAIMSVMPKLFVQACIVGTMRSAIKSATGEDPGEDLEEFYKRVSSYKTEHGDVLPLFWWAPDGSVHPLWGHQHVPEEWVAVGFRMPNSEEGRITGTLARNVATELDEETRSPEQTEVWTRWVMSQLPGLNPAIEVVAGAVNAYQGVNMIDSYRNQPIIPYHEFRAGGMIRAKAIARWMLSTVTSPMLAKPPRNDVSGMSPTQQKVASLPVIRSLFTFDNYKQGAQQARERATSGQADSRMKLALGQQNPAGKLLEYHGKLVRLGEAGRTEQQQDLYEKVLRPWHLQVWRGRTKDGQKISGYKDRLLKAAMDKDNDELKALAEATNLASTRYLRTYETLLKVPSRPQR